MDAVSYEIEFLHHVIEGDDFLSGLMPFHRVIVKRPVGVFLDFSEDRFEKKGRDADILCFRIFLDQPFIRILEMQ